MLDEEPGFGFSASQLETLNSDVASLMGSTPGLSYYFIEAQPNDWPRPYLVCPKGHGSEVPHDRVLKLGPGQASPKLAAILARLAIEVPFDQVPDVVAEALGLSVDGEMVRRVTEHLGSWAESEEQTRIRATQRGHLAAPSAPGSDTLRISLDGAMVHTQRLRDGRRGWHEAKVGVCALRRESVTRIRGEGRRETLLCIGRL